MLELRVTCIDYVTEEKQGSNASPACVMLSRYGRQPEKRAFTKPYLCAFCQLMPTTDFVVFCWRQEMEK